MNNQAIAERAINIINKIEKFNINKKELTLEMQYYIRPNYMKHFKKNINHVKPITLYALEQALINILRKRKKSVKRCIKKRTYCETYLERLTCLQDKLIRLEISSKELSGEMNYYLRPSYLIQIRDNIIGVKPIVLYALEKAVNNIFKKRKIFYNQYNN